MRLDEVDAEHQRRAAREFHRARRAGQRRRPPLRSGGSCRAAALDALGIDQQGTDGRGIGVGFQCVGQDPMVEGSTFGVVVQEEDVLGVGGAPAQVQGLGQAEIFRQADELDVGKIVVNAARCRRWTRYRRRSPGWSRAVGGFDGFAGTRNTRPVARDHHHRNAWRLLRLFGIGLWGQTPRIAGIGARNTSRLRQLDGFDEAGDEFDLGGTAGGRAEG